MKNGSKNIFIWESGDINMDRIFLNVGPPKESIFLTTTLLQYSSTLGMPDSVYAWFDIVSNTCHPAPCFF